ncbi:hypothetical protein ABRY23_09935 [Melioribacteraceae bacterium 4301-Me]|uniref:hypothetical protein n=1 Tax=Pyranulibacter aquaticus TaxID=3163344 RepID=UPI003598E222
MKCSIFILFIAILSSNISAQGTEKQTAFSSFHFEVLIGVNFASFQNLGSSLMIVGKTNATHNLNVNFSIGYSEAYKKDKYNIKSFRYINIDNSGKYQTYTYNREKIEYDIIPISAGVEYIFENVIFSPLFFLDAGYNFYSTKIHTTPIEYNVAGSYDTYNEIPAEYRNLFPPISKDWSYSFKIGIGSKVSITPSIYFEMKYFYQFNRAIPNTNNILLGIVF